MAEEKTNYLCKKEDLDKYLDEKLTKQFQSLFYDFDKQGQKVQKKAAWRMFWRGMTPNKFLARFGIDIDHPTVRAGVAFDLIKLEDSCMSNDIHYLAEEHITNSTSEYERMVLNRNFRVNLINLEKEWSNVTYKDSTVKKHRTCDKVYQGARFSENILGYFNSIFSKAFTSSGELNQIDIDNDVYLPFTNGLDFTTEIALIPYNHPDLSYVTSRAYYDGQYRKYKRLLAKNKILAISTFALIDPEKRRNHTGKYLVKVQKRFSENSYGYISAVIDKDGQFQRTADGKLDIDVWKSRGNLILNVCEDDYMLREDEDYIRDVEIWTPEYGTPTIGKSSTSSQYSVFVQKIPDEDLKNVRNYLQLKTRLEGMELGLEQIKRDIDRKEVRASEAFIEQTKSIWNLFQEFNKNKELVDMVIQFYDLIAKYDDLSLKKAALETIVDNRNTELDTLIKEYNTIGINDLANKLELGEKIHSLRLELDNNVKKSIQSIQEQMESIVNQLKALKEKIEARKNRKNKSWPGEESEELPDGWDIFKDSFSSQVRTSKESTSNDFKKKSDEAKEKFRNKTEDLPTDDELDEVDSSISSLEQEINNKKSEINSKWKSYSRDVVDLGTDIIDTTELNKLVRITEKWRGYMYNIGYELNQLKKMQTKCDDATIQVRRLLRNFKDKIDQTESTTWDSETHRWKKGFDITSIVTASIHDIILLYDWYWINAGEKTYSDMGYETEDEFQAFRDRCKNIGLSLRKNQYRKSLASDRNRIQKEINDLMERIDGKDQLEYKDKYGWEAKKSQDAEEAAKNKKSKSKNIDMTSYEEADEELAEAERHQRNEQKYIDLYKKEMGLITPKITIDAIFAKAEKELAEQEKKQRVVDAQWNRENTARLEKPKTEQSLLMQADKELGQMEARMLQEENALAQYQKKYSKRAETEQSMLGKADVELELEEIEQKQIDKYIEEHKSIKRAETEQSMLGKADAELTQKEKEAIQYKKDCELMKSRTISYLIRTGLIENEQGLVDLATKSQAMHFEGDLDKELSKVQVAKDDFDEASELLKKHRQTLKGIIDQVSNAEKKIQELESQNKKLFNMCLTEKTRILRNRLLATKLENETKISKLKSMVSKQNKKHLSDFTSLNELKTRADQCQKKYEESVKNFKENIGLNENSINQLAIKIYNRYQDEILAHVAKKEGK